MGQKVHPIGFRLAVASESGPLGHQSKWFSAKKGFSTILTEDRKIREYLKKTLDKAMVSKIEIQRLPGNTEQNTKVKIFTARPGIIIGKKGEDIEKLRAGVKRHVGIPVQINIEEIRKPDVDATLVAKNICEQLEKRIMFRRAMKRAVGSALRQGAKGIKVRLSGRLGGAEIARTEWYREGRVPLHTLRAIIDYGFVEAKTTYGIIGVKVWIFKGEASEEEEQQKPATSSAAA